MNIEEVCEKIIEKPGSFHWLGQSFLESLLKEITDYYMELPNIVKPNGATLFVGDIHGDLKSMISAFAIAAEKEANILFLGDVVDRGRHDIECVNLLIAKIVQEPDRIFYIRGNHEFKEINSRWGFADRVKKRYGEGVSDLYNTWFTTLPLAALMNGRTLAIHGGLCKEVPTLKDLASLDRVALPFKDERAAFLWNDPSEEVDGFEVNKKRGVFYHFGRDVFDDFMDKENLELMIRAHEVWPEGHKYFFDNRLISVFSCGEFYKDVEPKAVLVRDDGGHEILALQSTLTKELEAHGSDDNQDDGHQ